MKPPLLETLSVTVVLAVGSLQILGFLTGAQPLRQLGQVSAAAPLPRVFSEFRGLETFSLEWTVSAETTDGQTLEQKITPELYNRFEGPYNWRNIYGAALAYGPKLTSPSEKILVSLVLRSGFCHQGPLAAMFANRNPLRKVLIITRSKTQKDQGPFREELTCL